ncbi:hypothetical protein Tco_0724198 [Tanacetum coccineum]
MLGATIQRDIERYYPKRYWEILHKEILEDITQRDIGSHYPKRYWESLPEDILGITTLRDTSIIGDVEQLGIDVEELGCEVARLGVAKKCCLGLVVPRVEEETKRRMWILGDQVGSLSTL